MPEADQARPLRGRRIVVTRARSQASSLVSVLNLLGAEVIELPTIEIVPIESYAELDATLGNIASYQWLVVTSANTVRVLAERIGVVGIDSAIFARLKKVAVGSATAKAMQEQGIGVDVIPEKYVAESLLEAIGDRLNGNRVLLARASSARDVIPEELTRRGALVDVVDAYRTVIPTDAVARMREVFSNQSRLPDGVTFTSSSTVKNFVTLWNAAGLGGIPKQLKAISIGPITSQTLQEDSWAPAIEAKPHDQQGLVDAIVLLLRS